MARDPKPKNNEKLTATNVAAALFEARGVKAEAARRLGVDWSTIQRYIKKYPSVRQALDEAVEPITDMARSNVIMAIFRGDLAESHWWLSRKTDEFMEKVRSETTGQGGGPIVIEFVYGDGDGEEEQHGRRDRDGVGEGRGDVHAPSARGGQYEAGYH